MSSPRTGALKRGTPVDSENLTNTLRYLRNGVSYYLLIGSRKRASIGTESGDLE